MGDRSRWRYRFVYENFESCKGVTLKDGIILWEELPQKYAFVDSLKFTSICEDGLPLYSSFSRFENGCPYLPAVRNDWERFIGSDDYGGSFKNSAYSIIYAVTANFIITIFLTVLVFINIPTKPSKKASYILKTGALFATINLCIFIVRVWKDVADNYIYEGYVSSRSFLNLLWNDKAFAAIDLVAVFLLQVSQVQIVMRFFDRIQEKRIVLYLGMFLIIVTQILWVIPTFSTIPIENSHSDIDILPPFVYLFRIALSTCYASVVCFQILTKRKFCFRGMMAMLTLLTLITALLHPVFFIVDVANIWLDDLSEIFNTTCYLASTVLVLEWSNRTHTMERKIQASSVLGRPIYEAEEQDLHFAIYALRVQSALKGKNGAAGDTFYDSCNNSNGSEGQSRGSGDDGFLQYTTESDVHQLGQLKNDNALRTHTSGSLTSNMVSTSSISNDAATLHAQQGEANITEFRRSETFWTKCHHVLDSIIYYTDKVIVNGLAGPKTQDSGTNGSDKMFKIDRVRKTIALDEPEVVYLYQKTNISSESIAIEEHEMQDNSSSDPQPSSSAQDRFV